MHDSLQIPPLMNLIFKNRTSRNFDCSSYCESEIILRNRSFGRLNQRTSSVKITGKQAERAGFFVSKAGEGCFYNCTALVTVSSNYHISDAQKPRHLRAARPASNGSKRNGENKNAFHFARPITERLRAPQVARRLFSERYFPVFCIPLVPTATFLSFILPYFSFLTLFTFYLFKCKLLGASFFRVLSLERHIYIYTAGPRLSTARIHAPIRESYLYRMTPLRLSLINTCIALREKSLALDTTDIRWFYIQIEETSDN